MTSKLFLYMTGLTIQIETSRVNEGIFLPAASGVVSRYQRDRGMHLPCLFASVMQYEIF